MVQEGQYRGGHLPYGYKLEHQGRTNKKNQQVRDLVVDEDEATIVKEIFDLLTNHGYGTNRVAQYLNEKGIKTKRGTSLWRGTSIRAIIDNPIYIGIYHMQGVQSEPFDHLKIIDEDLFMRCQQTVKGRSTKNYDGEPVVFRTDTRSLLTGVIYCGHCGCRLCYNHHHEERKLAIAVLEEGMSYKPISISPEQAQFLETRKFQIDEIARIFRVPPHMVGDLDKSSFSNIEQQSLEFVKYTLSPWITRWEQTIHRSLLLPSEKPRYFARFNVEGLLRGDYQSRMNGYAVGRQNGWMSANDIRELENLDRIPAEAGGDLYLINGNMTKLADAGLFAGKEATRKETI